MEVDGEETKPALDERGEAPPPAASPLAARGAHAPHGEGGSLSDTDDSLDASLEASRGGEHGGVGANARIDRARSADSHEISLTRRTRPPSIRIADTLTPLGPRSGPRQSSPIAEGDEEVPPCASA